MHNRSQGFKGYSETKRCPTRLYIILGPLFFLLYINDINNYASKILQLILFADDTNIFLPSHKDADCLANILNTELNKLV